MGNIKLVGFDADDTLWKCEDYYRAAQDEFERILGRYLDLGEHHQRVWLWSQGHGAVDDRNRH